MKAVELLINSELPEELKSQERQYDSRGLSDLMVEIARNYPEHYSRISKRLSDIGRNASYNQGETLHLGDLYPVMDKDSLMKQMALDIEKARKQSKSDEEFENKRTDIWTTYSEKLKKMTSQKALSNRNNLAYSVVSGARGNPAQLQAMLTTPGLYLDALDRPVPIFVERSFSEGLRPAEFLAGTYGARKAVLSTKRATAKGGDLAKQMVQNAAPIVITTEDCGVSNGLDYSLEDDSLKGRVLAKDVNGIPAGTPIDRAVLADLRKNKVDQVIARSPLTCQAESGLCSKCVGLDASNKFRPIGDSIGITAAQAIGEPITQGALNVKHTGGQASGKREYSGFNWINQFVQTPESFPDRAVLSEVEGIVDSIEEAPQGGTYVTVENENHYIPMGFDISVKVGDKLEAGDAISVGLTDPGDVVRLRGLGEGRRYYSERLKQMMDDSGMFTDKRNTEILARAALDHIKVDDPDPDDPWLPDDVVSYNDLMYRYNPDKDAKRKNVKDSFGQYLQTPVLHYSIGDKVTKAMQNKIKGAGISEVFVSSNAPKFSPLMPRLRTASHSNPDWLASMHTSYLKGQISHSAVRGEDTNVEFNEHFAPRIAFGENFGDIIGDTGKF